VQRSNGLPSIRTRYEPYQYWRLDFRPGRLHLVIVRCTKLAQAVKGTPMKREYVVPDLLASMTADALFSLGSPKNSTESTRPKLNERLGRWLRRAPKQTTDGACFGPADDAHGPSTPNVEMVNASKDAS
jgi:hypothetical protein